MTYTPAKRAASKRWRLKKLAADPASATKHQTPASLRALADYLERNS